MRFGNNRLRRIFCTRGNIVRVHLYMNTETSFPCTMINEKQLCHIHDCHVFNLNAIYTFIYIESRFVITILSMILLCILVYNISINSKIITRTSNLSIAQREAIVLLILCSSKLIGMRLNITAFKRQYPPISQVSRSSWIEM